MSVNLCKHECCTTCKYKGVFLCTCSKLCENGEHFIKKK